MRQTAPTYDDNVSSASEKTAGRGWVTTGELAKLCDVPTSAIQTRIRRKRFTMVSQRSGRNMGRGGKIWLINIADPAIPDSARERYYSSLPHPQTVTHKETVKAVSSGEPSFVQGRAERMLPVPASPDSMVPENLKTIALARVDLVTAWRDHRRLYGGSHGMRLKADETFEKAYNMGLLLPQVFEVLGKVDLSTVYRWHRALAGTTDWSLLVPDWRSLERKEPSLTPVEKKIFSVTCFL